MKSVCALVALATMLVVSNVFGQWQIDGSIICDENHRQTKPNVISDGTGGWIVAWNDDRDVDGNFDLYAQRITALNDPLWLYNGLPICLANNEQYPHVMCMTSDNEVFIAWQDHRDSYVRIYAQRVRLDGTTLWAFDGVIVSSTGSRQGYHPELYTYDDGSVVIIWRDSSNYVRAQRVDPDGNKMWTTDGEVLCSYNSSKSDLQIITDMRGGTIVTWYDSRGSGDVYAQRVDSTGSTYWGSYGIPVTSHSSPDRYPKTVTDGDGGAIVFWLREYSGYDAAVAQRIYRNGNQLWGSNGVELTPTQNQMWDPKLVSDEVGGAIAQWREQKYSGRVYLMLQRIDTDGNVLWPGEGVNIGRGEKAQMIPDGSGGAIVNWLWGDILIQRVNIDGEIQYPMSSMIGADGTREYLTVAGDGTGRSLSVWDETRFDHYYDIFAQSVSSDGDWAMPGPDITAVSDIESDEGGYVRLAVDRSHYDQGGDITDNIIIGYNIWRRMDTTASSSFGNTGALSLVELQQLFLEGVTGDGRIELDKAASVALGLPDGNWESIGYHAAMRYETYDFVVPTRQDYVLGSPAYETFYVTAHTDDPSIYYWSEPDSGYSVDNLAPMMPSGVETARGVSSYIISWDPNSEADMFHYSLYYGEGEDFAPSELNRVLTTTETQVNVHPNVPVPPWHYKLSAVDRHFNESDFAIVYPETLIVPTTVTEYDGKWRETHVEISWRLSLGLDSYNYRVSRSTAGHDGFFPLDGETETNNDICVYKDEDVQPGTKYRYRVAVLSDGEEETTFEVGVDVPSVATGLGQNFPNPFNPATTIPFVFDGPSHVILNIYDVNGRLVRTLVDKTLGNGFKRVEWDGKDDNGDAVGSGVYFCRLQVGNKTFERKMLLLK